MHTTVSELVWRGSESCKVQIPWHTVGGVCSRCTVQCVVCVFVCVHVCVCCACTRIMVLCKYRSTYHIRSKQLLPFTQQLIIIWSCWSWNISSEYVDFSEIATFELDVQTEVQNCHPCYKVIWASDNWQQIQLPARASQWGRQVRCSSLWRFRNFE